MNVLVTVRLFCRNQLIAFSSVIISLVLNYIQSESYFSFSMSNQSFGCKAYVPARTYNVCVRMGVCVFKAAGCVQLMSFTYLCSLCIWWIHEWENPEIACELRTIFKPMKTFPENRNIYSKRPVIIHMHRINIVDKAELCDRLFVRNAGEKSIPFRNE